MPEMTSLTVLPPPRAAAAGAAAGVVVTGLGALLAGPAADYLPYAVLLLLAIAVVGLAVSAIAAAWAYAASALTLLVIALVSGDRLEPSAADLARLAVFMLGAPAVVFLVLRVESARRQVAHALEASHLAAAEAAAERERSDSARRELDTALGAAERERKRLEEVAEAIPEPLIVYDDTLLGTYGNRAALRLFGRSFVERAIDDWARVALPRDEHGQPLERSRWPQVRAQETAFKSRMTLRVPMSGKDLLVDVEGTPVPGGGCVLLLRDVGREEDERRRLSRFASFVAHELRNPLAVAKARIELATRDGKLRGPAGSHVAKALDSVDAAIGILERLELYSRADSGGVEARHEAFALRPAVDAAVERLRARGGDREVTIDVADGARVLGDLHLTQQAITNLLINADRYSTVGRPIHVTAVDDGETTALRVRDEGPGVPDDVAERLFHDRVAVGRGLGLGLYLVRATMNAMGGSVELEQREPEAIFTLRWRSAPPSALETDGAGPDADALAAAVEPDAAVATSSAREPGAAPAPRPRARRERAPRRR
jgi:signal transduction histidine kinase